MKLLRPNVSIHLNSPADRRLLFHGLTLIALGLSVLFLNSGDRLFVRASVGLFWGSVLFDFELVRSGSSAKKSQSLKWITPPQHRMILSPTVAIPASSPSIICR